MENCATYKLKLRNLKTSGSRWQTLFLSRLMGAEVGSMLGLGAAGAFDAYLVNGGLPLICEEWPLGATLWEYLATATNSPTSALLVSAERALAAELPTEVQARDVLAAIGSGERSHAKIARAAADTSPASLSRALIFLAQKRLVATDRPLSTKPSRETRYRVADPYLRFWLAFLGASIPEVERGRGDRVFARIQQAWPSWRGRAIEPILRAALDRMPTETFGAGRARQPVVGGFWTRNNDPEIDVVVADRAPIAKSIFAIGSIKWREQSAFDARDHGALLEHCRQVPGATEHTQLIAVSRSGCSVAGLRVFEPAELIEAWRS